MDHSPIAGPLWSWVFWPPNQFFSGHLPLNLWESWATWLFYVIFRLADFYIIFKRTVFQSSFCSVCWIAILPKACFFSVLKFRFLNRNVRNVLLHVLHFMQSLELQLVHRTSYFIVLHFLHCLEIEIVQSLFFALFKILIFNRFFFACFCQQIGHRTYEMLHCHGFDFQHMLDGTQLMGCGCYVGAAEDDNVPWTCGHGRSLNLCIVT